VVERDAWSVAAAAGFGLSAALHIAAMAGHGSAFLSLVLSVAMFPVFMVAVWQHPKVNKRVAGPTLHAEVSWRDALRGVPLWLIAGQIAAVGYVILLGQTLPIADEITISEAMSQPEIAFVCWTLATGYLMALALRRSRRSLLVPPIIP
jgi:hypothetical protein